MFAQFISFVLLGVILFFVKISIFLKLFLDQLDQHLRPTVNIPSYSNFVDCIRLLCNTQACCSFLYGFSTSKLFYISKKKLLMGYYYHKKKQLPLMCY